MVTAPGTRGNIYDRNGKLLAYNELAYSVTIQDLGDYPRPADRNAMIYRLVTILERRGEKVEGKLEIAINEQGEMYFTTTSKASHKRFLLNFYGISSEKLDDASGRYPSDITAREAFELKKSSGRDGYNLNDMKDEEGNPLELTDQTALDMINIIYTMKLTEYQKYESTTVATNVSRETMTEIHENAADLKGVSVEESYIRVYNDSLYFSPIIGYTGKVQEEQVDRLNEQWREEENKRVKISPRRMKNTTSMMWLAESALSSIWNWIFRAKRAIPKCMWIIWDGQGRSLSSRTPRLEMMCI